MVLSIISSIQLPSHVRLLWPHGLQHTRLPHPISCSQSLLIRLMSIESVMPSSHLIFCCPLLLLPSVFSSIRVFIFQCVNSSHQVTSYGVLVSESVLPLNFQDWFPLGLTDLISLQSKGLSRVFSNTTVQKHQFFSAQLSLWSNSHIHTWLLEKP